MRNHPNYPGPICPAVDYENRSASVHWEMPVRYEPTARQPAPATHETPDSPLPIAPLGFGPTTSDQRLPSQCSADATAPNPASSPPTATQYVALEHETPRRLLSGSVTATDHLVPFHASTRL